MESLISQQTRFLSFSSSSSYVKNINIHFFLFSCLFFSSLLNSFSPPILSMYISPSFFFLVFFFINILYDFFSLLNFTCNYIKVICFLFCVFVFTIFVFLFCFNFFLFLIIVCMLL